MQDIQKMTDAELVEAVAREVMGWDDVVHYTLDRRGLVRTHPDNIGIAFNPFADINDLFMVLERFGDWQINLEDSLYVVTIFTGLLAWVEVKNQSLPRAVLEACLSAERGKG